MIDQSQHFKQLDPKTCDVLFDFWFRPWVYAHPKYFVENQALASNLQQNPQQNLFADINQLDGFAQAAAYIPYCQAYNLPPLLPVFNLKWFSIHLQDIYRQPDELSKAVELLGAMVPVQIKHQIKAQDLRWCYQHRLARPIQIKDEAVLVQINNCFELGLLVLHQLIQAFAMPIWGRFAMVFEPLVLQQQLLEYQPLFTAPMLLIIQKHWLRILQYIKTA